MLPEIEGWLNIMTYLYKPDNCHQERKIQHKRCWTYVYVLAIYNNQETVINLQNKATCHYPNDTLFMWNMQGSLEFSTLSWVHFEPIDQLIHLWFIQQDCIVDRMVNGRTMID